jgi:hypothetical protein
MRPQLRPGATSAYQVGPSRTTPARLGQAEDPGLPGSERVSGAGEEPPVRAHLAGARL